MNELLKLIEELACILQAGEMLENEKYPSRIEDCSNENIAKAKSFVYRVRVIK